jgi:hypothetical protein
MSTDEKDNVSTHSPPAAQYDAEKTGYVDDGLVRGEAKSVSADAFLLHCGSS